MRIGFPHRPLDDYTVGLGWEKDRAVHRLGKHSNVLLLCLLKRKESDCVSELLMMSACYGSVSEVCASVMGSRRLRCSGTNAAMTACLLWDRRGRRPRLLPLARLPPAIILTCGWLGWYQPGERLALPWSLRWRREAGRAGLPLGAEFLR